MIYYHIFLLKRHVVNPLEIDRKEGDILHTFIYESESDELEIKLRSEKNNFKIVVYGLNYELAAKLRPFKHNLFALIPLGFEIYNYRKWLGSFELIERIFFILLRPKLNLSRLYRKIFDSNYKLVLSSFEYYVTPFEKDYSELCERYNLAGNRLNHYVFYRKLDIISDSAEKKCGKIILGNSFSLSSNSLSFILFKSESKSHYAIQSSYGDKFYLTISELIVSVRRGLIFEKEYKPFSEYISNLRSHDIIVLWNRRPEGITTIIICVQLKYTIVLNPKSLLCDFLDEIGIKYVKWSKDFQVLSARQKDNNLELLEKWLIESTGTLKQW